jgi:hypothetical protein
MPKQHFSYQGKIKVQGAQLQNLETYEIENQAIRNARQSPVKAVSEPDSANKD